MDILLKIKGLTPLLQHNEQLADPENEWAVALHEISSKRKKTPADYAEMRRIEWFGGVYVRDGKVIVPTKCLRRMLLIAAKQFRMGKQAEMAIMFSDLDVPLVYDGPGDIQELQRLARFNHNSLVGINGRRVSRCRPMFYPWSVEARVILIDSIFSFSDLDIVAQRAGIVGLMDGRTVGYGKGEVTLVKLTERED